MGKGIPVKITVRGIHDATYEAAEVLGTCAEGELYEAAGSSYVLYEEKHEGFAKTAKCRIKFKPDSIELHKEGVITSHMIFEERKKHLSVYKTPYGDMRIGIDTQKVACTRTDDLITLVSNYVLELDGTKHTESRIEIIIEYI